MQKNLTDRYISTSKPSERQLDVWDLTLTGFGLRISPGGKKSFQILYRHNRLYRRLVIGSYPVMSLADARKWAKNLLGEVAKGHDPAAQRLANRNAGTFGETRSGLPESTTRSEGSAHGEEDERVINADHCFPLWKPRKAKDIARREIPRPLCRRLQTVTPGAISRVLSLIRQIFNYGIDNDWLELNSLSTHYKTQVSRASVTGYSQSR